MYGESRAGGKPSLAGGFFVTLPQAPKGGEIDMGLFGKKCPKCGSYNLSKVKPSLWKKWQDASIKVVFFPFSLFRKGAKTLNVCRDCGFDWEDR